MRPSTAITHQRQPRGAGAVGEEEHAHIIIVAERRHRFARLRGRGKMVLDTTCTCMAGFHCCCYCLSSCLHCYALSDRQSQLLLTACRPPSSCTNLMPLVCRARATSLRASGNCGGGGEQGTTLDSWAGHAAQQAGLTDRLHSAAAHPSIEHTRRTWLNTRLFSLGVVVCRCSSRRSSASTLALHSPWGWICAGATGQAEAGRQLGWRQVRARSHDQSEWWRKPAMAFRFNLSSAKGVSTTPGNV